MEEKYRQQFKKGALERVLLSVVARGKTYGYEIILTLNRRGVPLFQNIREGTLYPVLHKLEAEGCIRAYEKVVDGRRRRYYSITEKGCEKLEEYRHQWREYEQKVNTVLFGEAHT